MLVLAVESVARVVDVFPANGMDRSLHTPVLVGLVILTFFRETLGWTYAGLVVPGYLASVFLVAPVTGVLVVCESLAAYLLAALLGRWMARSGAWSTHFGRERFLLLILAAVMCRLVFEASLLPYLTSRYHFEHSRQLYSIGLVLVPLLANSYWNAGVRHAFPRVAVVTVLTYWFVDQVLLTYTNLTMARFQVANESVSLAFLEAPHAYIILVIGAVIAARDNIRYGWDYNGILVPALLAIACYQPTKLVTTVVEALVILFAARLISGLPPLSSLLIVGSRRMLITFGTGFALKLLLGHAFYRFAPEVQMVDLSGFGYLLPSLLAVKMWNTSRIGATLMPALHVAVVAFLAGNALGAGMRYLDGIEITREDAPATIARSSRPVSMALVLADTAPAPETTAVRWGETTPHQQALLALKELHQSASDKPTLSTRWGGSLKVQRHDSNWWTFQPRSDGPSLDPIAPRFAFNVEAPTGPGWLVVADADRVGAAVSVVGHRIATLLGAAGFGLRSRLPEVRSYDDAFLRQAKELLGLDRVLLIRETAASAATLSAVGSLPSGLDVQGLGASLGRPLEVTWRAPADDGGLFSNSAILQLPRRAMARAAAVELGAPKSLAWSESVDQLLSSKGRGLTDVAPGRFRAPDIEQIRLFGKVLVPALLSLRSGGTPSQWQRALALRLGYEFAHLKDGWALVEPPGDGRRGNATLVVTQADHGGSGTPLLVEVPAPRWERGTLEVAAALRRAVDAAGLLIAGAMPSVEPDGTSDVRRPAGARSYYQHAHEVWIQGGGNAVAVHGILGLQVDSDAIVTFGRETTDPTGNAPWTRPIVATLLDNSLTVASVDGSVERERFDGSTNPPFSYVRRFGEDQMLLLWLTARVRDRFLGIRQDDLTERRLQQGRDRPVSPNVLDRAWTLAQCPDEASSGSDCPRPENRQKCQLDSVVQDLLAYNGLRNPYVLRAALGASTCSVELARDAPSGRVWALVPGPSEVELVPLRTGPTVRAKSALAERQRLRASVALGLSTVRIERAP